MTLKEGDRVMEFGNKMAPSANGKIGTVITVGDQPTFGYREIKVDMDDLIVVSNILENRLRLVKEYEPLSEGDRVEFTNENGNVVKGTVSEHTEGVITGKASVFVKFDDGSSIVGMEFEFTKIEEEWDDGMFFVGDYVKNNCESDSIFYGRKGTIVGYGELYNKHSGRSVIVKMDDDGQESTMMEGELVKADNESRFKEGDEVVVSDPEMRCYGEHGIVESVQVMEESASKPTMLVKLIDPVEYLLYGEECFESLGEFYENEEKEDDMVQEEDQEETFNGVQIVFNDGSEVNTIALSCGSIEDDLLDKLNHTNHSIRIGNIVTKVDNINYVRVNEVV